MKRPLFAILAVLMLPGCGQAVLAAKLNSLNDQFGGRIQMSERKIPAAVIGEPYQLQLRAWGGTPPYQWEIIQGDLPIGLDLDASSGRITGIPESEFAGILVVLVRDRSDDPESYLLKALHPPLRDEGEE